MKHINRQERLQVLLALLGLLFACFSAAFIITHVVPRPTTTVIALSPETQAYLEEMERYWVDGSQTMIRGHRRLLSNDMDPSQSVTENSSTSITPSPSSSPTFIVEQILPPLIPQNQNVEGSTASGTDAAPAIMVGLASCIIVFAVLLYANDVRDRLQENSDGNDNKSDSEIVEGATSAGSTANGESGYWINTTSSAIIPHPLLPLIASNQSSPQQDDASISRLSTMTESMMESPWSFGVDEKMMALENSSQVTELSDEHLVPFDMSALTTLMKSRRDDDSLESIDDTLLGDRFSLEEESYEPMDSPRPSFENSPDKYCTPDKMEARDAPSEGSEDSDERVGPLEELITDICFDQTNSPSVVRDIYFHPGNIKVSIGLQVEMKDGYPIIVAVESFSPLVGRVFCGDCILTLNDMGSNTFSPKETCLGRLGDWLDGQRNDH